MVDQSAAWNAHHTEQRRAWLRLTYAERLQWLWQAKLFAQRAQEAARLRAKQTRRP